MLISPDKLNDNISAKTRNAYLARLGFLQHLDSFIHDRVHERKPVSDALMATTMEAILGAVFLDSGKDFYQIRKVAVALNLLRPGYVILRGFILATYANTR